MSTKVAITSLTKVKIFSKLKGNLQETSTFLFSGKSATIGLMGKCPTDKSAVWGKHNYHNLTDKPINHAKETGGRR